MNDYKRHSKESMPYFTCASSASAMHKCSVDDMSHILWNPCNLVFNMKETFFPINLMWQQFGV